MHSKNLEKCGKNYQSARRKPNYYTKCDNNYHKILAVQNQKNRAKKKFYLVLATILSIILLNHVPWFIAVG